MESSILTALLGQGPIGIVCVILLVLYVRKDRECRELGEKLESIYEDAIGALTRARDESDKRANDWAVQLKTAMSENAAKMEGLTRELMRGGPKP